MWLQAQPSSILPRGSPASLCKGAETGGLTSLEASPDRQG